MISSVEEQINCVEIKSVVLDFVKSNADELEMDGYFWLEIWENENNFHESVYWISGSYTLCESFIRKQWTVFGENLFDAIIGLYNERIGPIDSLEAKVKNEYRSGSYKGFLAYEALASLVLQEYQTRKIWCIIYGCEETDMYDLKFGHHILHALNNEMEYPVVKLEDVTGALVGVSDMAQTSSLYDVFAHKADCLMKPKKPSECDQIQLLSLLTDSETNEPIFTPDTFQYDAVVSRFKRYERIRKEMSKARSTIDYFELYSLIEKAQKLKNVTLRAGVFTDGFEDYVYAQEMAYTIKEDYIDRFSSPPYGLPLLDENITIHPHHINGRICLTVIFQIRGICRGLNEWRVVHQGAYEVPNSAEELMATICKVASDIKMTLAGSEKDAEKEAEDGMFPRRNLVTHGLKIPKIPLYLAEHQALYVMRKVLMYSSNPVVNCSFGKDSITILHLFRRISKSGYNVHFTNSRNEYGETLSHRDFLVKEWNLNLIESRPDITYWDFLDKYGWNFERKGYRSKGKSSRSEICCSLLKHKPALKAIKAYGFDAGFTGVRADESRQRDKAGKHNGIAYTSVSWNQLIATPIMFFTNEMVWEYTRKYNVPQSKLYEKILYDDDGNVKYVPRTGCAACLLTLKHGYGLWMKEFYPKLYKHLMRDRGLAETLYRLSMGLDERECSSGINNQSKKHLKGQLTFIEGSIMEVEQLGQKNSNVEEILTDMESLYLLMEARPCMFTKNLP